MKRIDTLLEKYVESINTCNTELAREIWDKEGSVSFIYPRGRDYGFEDIKENFYLGVMDKLFSKGSLKLNFIMTK